MYTADEIKEFLIKNGIPGEKTVPKISKIILTYDIDEVIDLERKKAKLNATKNKLLVTIDKKKEELE